MVEHASNTSPVNKIVPLDRIKPHPENYNTHPDEQLKQLGASYSELGQFRSVVLWEQADGTYIQLAGHGVLEAMRRNDAKEVRADVLPPSLDPLAAKRIMLADNLHAQNSVPDDTLLAQLLQEQQDAGFDLASLGTDDETLRQMLESLGDEFVGSGESERDEAEDELPEEVETRAKVGDVWQVGRHKLIVGNSADPEILKALMQGEKADMILTDPPYGMAYEPNHDDRRVKHNYNGAGYHNVKHQNMIVGDDVPFDPTPLLTYFHDVKEQFWWGADYYADLLPDRIKGSWLVWDKRAGIEDMQFNTSHFELCWSRARHLREIIRVKWFGIQGTEQQDIKHRLHPTQKPLQAIDFILEKYSEIDNLVVDPYLGSGTTLIACERLGRRCFGCEIKPEFADIVLSRWEKHSGGTATLLERVEEVAHV